MSFDSSQVNTQDAPIATKGRPAATSGRASSGMFHAIVWTGTATWITQLITWAYTFILARMLKPSDYGLIGMANVLLGFLTVASEFGIGSAVVAMPDLNEDQISQLNTVAVISGVVLFALACVTAYPLGHFFRAPDLPSVVIILSLMLVITSFKTIPDALLQREFCFKLLAQIQAAQAVSYAVAAVTAVLLGAGYWSLVIASLTGVTASTVLVLRGRLHAFSWPKLAALRRSLVLSTHILGLRVAWYCNSTADFAVAGRVLGPAALGSYNVAWSIAEQPLQKFTDLVTRVAPSYFSRVQNDDAALGKYVLAITQSLSLLTLPATLGLALVADDFVTVVLGPKWANSVLPLRILAVYAAVRAITSFFAPLLLNIRGQSRFVMWNHILAALGFTGAFYLGSRWGIVGIAWVWPLLYPFAAIPLFVRMISRLKLSLQAYVACLLPALSGSLIMVVSLVILKRVLPAAMHERLAIEIATAAVIYCTTIAGLYPAQFRRICTLIRPTTRAAALAPEQPV